MKVLMKPGVRPALELFLLIPLAAVALAVISSVVMFQIGIPRTPAEHLQTSVLVALCVSVPMASLAAQYDYRIRRSHEKLEALASTDPLTGLLNRRSFLSAVSDEMARMRRTGNLAALAYIDLDRFKPLNDQFGHHFGDTVLCEIAVLFHEELRHPFDKVGRWGGEEFVIMISNVTVEQVELVFERLRARIADHVFTDGKISARVTASFGVALLRANSDIEDVTRLADRALYNAKATGRNRVVFPQPAAIATSTELRAAG